MMSTKNLFRLLTVLFTSTVISSVANAQFIVRVDGDQGSAIPAGLGTDWGADAYAFLQDGLARAEEILAENPPDTTVQLWVAATDENNPYRPDGCATCGPLGTPGGSGLRTASFNLINDVELYGGFSGNETVLIQCNPEGNETVLSGLIAQEPPDNPACGPGAGPCDEANEPPAATTSCAARSSARLIRSAATLRGTASARTRPPICASPQRRTTSLRPTA